MTHAVTEPAADAGPDGAAPAASPTVPPPAPRDGGSASYDDTPLSTRVWASLYVRLLGTRASDRYWGWMGPALITIFGGFIRFYRLGDPPKLVFDEAYYVRQGVSMLLFGYEQRWIPNEGDVEPAKDFFEAGTPNVFQTATDQADFVVHPPLGKWMIALGERIFGMDNPFGWRFTAALCGTLSILMIARVARRMFGSTLLGCVAGLLLAVDGNHIVHSRTGLLDIFVMFWALAAFACLLIDRDVSRAKLAAKVEAGADLSGAGPWLGLRWWRIAGFACIGACAGTKWSGIFFGAAFAVMSVLWDVGARRAAGVRSWWPGVLPLEQLTAGLGRLTGRRTTYTGRDAVPTPAGLFWWWTTVGTALAVLVVVIGTLKLPGIVAVPLAVLLVVLGLALDLGARRAGGDLWWWAKAFPLETLQAGITFLVVVPGVYLATWTGWFVTQHGYKRQFASVEDPSYGPGWIPAALRSLWKYHVEAYNFHVNVHDSHPYMANPWSWIVSGRPTAFWYDSPKLGERGCTSAECTIAILPIGNPVIWWGGALAILVLLFCWALRRDWRAGAILAGFVGGYLPWFRYQDRTIFQFYAIAFNPWVVLAVTFVIGLLLGRRTASPERRFNGAVAAGVIVVAACVLFVWFFPVNVGIMIPKTAWEARMWLPSWI